ncbi:MAG: putative Ig domain-containing protein [Pseudomonadota bacterium]
MKKTRNLLITIPAAGLLLTACGGGSGGGDSTAPPQPTNAAPTISGNPADSISAGSTYSFTPTASDPDGDTLTFSIENQPMWASFDTATGELSGTPFAANIGTTENVRISVSDGAATTDLTAFSLMVTPQKLSMANFAPGGDTFPTDDGYRSVGTLTMDTGERTQVFEDADLTLAFDEEGNLLELFGETSLPPVIADNVAVNAGIEAFVQMMSGAEISADPTFGIQLPDDINYFVYFLDAGVSLSVTNPVDPTIINVENFEVPIVEGQIHIISDPTDTMLYRYGELNGTGVGFGESYNRLLRYEPIQTFDGLVSFSGDSVERGTLNFGLKGGVELLEVEGYRVVREPTFSDIDWADPLNSPFQHRTGVNGIANFGLSVLNVGVFDFADVSLSAQFAVEPLAAEAAWSFTVDVGAEQEDTWVPDWFHILPRGGFNGNARFDSIGNFFFDIGGTFESRLPAGDLAGRIEASNDGVVFEGSTTGEGERLIMSLEFANSETIGRIEYPNNFEQSLQNDVSESLDRELARIDDSIADLEQATADYELEVSLRGLREALPPMMDAAVATAQGIPGAVYSAARSSALSTMRNTCRTVIVRVCLDDVAPANAIADSVATTARNAASSNVAPHIAAMQNLKARALEDDDEALRAALQAALSEAYNRRSYDYTITVRQRIDAGPFDQTFTLYNQRFRRDILSTSDAASVAEARDNVPLIQETSDRRIAAQDIVDNLPIRENVEQTKQDVDNGLSVLPVPSGFGYIASGSSYSAFVTINGTDYVTELNLLNPLEALQAGADAVADLLVDD